MELALMQSIDAANTGVQRYGRRDGARKLHWSQVQRTERSSREGKGADRA